MVVIDLLNYFVHRKKGLEETKLFYLVRIVFNLFPERSGSYDLDHAPFAQKLDNAIHWINHYSADRVVCFVNTYPLDSDFSGG